MSERVEAIKRIPLEKQYANFAQGLSRRLRGLPLEVWSKYQGQILHLISFNNEFASNLQNPLYQRIVQEEERKLAGDITMGATGCIDGRFAFIFVGGRFMSAWEEPAALIGMRQAGDGKIYPQSTRLSASLAANPHREIFEVSFAHSAVQPNLQLKPDGHHCGAMGTPELQKMIKHGETAQQANLRLLDFGIEAITNQYNAARAQFNLHQ